MAWETVGGKHVLLFIVARSRLDRYEELLWQLGGWRDVKIVLDRHEGERRTSQVAPPHSVKVASQLADRPTASSGTSDRREEDRG